MVASLGELLTVNAQQCGGRVALSSADRDVTWAELYHRARRVAAALADAGVPAQGRVFYLGLNSLSYLDVLYGAALADVIFVPLNWRLAATELAAIFDDVAASVVFVEPVLVDLIDQVLPLLGEHCTVVVADSAPSPPGSAEATPAAEVAHGTRETAEDHIAFQLYTSGTTGRPKGAMFANGTNVKTLLELISVKWDLRDDDIALAALPLFHMGGLAWVLAAMARRARVVLVNFEPEETLKVCERQQITTTFFVPAMLPPLIDAAQRRAHSLAIRRLMYSGAPIAPHVLTAAMKQFDCDFVQIYGMTEATGAFAQLDPDDHDPGGPREYLLRSAGRAYPWTEVLIADPISGRALSAGESGEVRTRSDQNMFGYFQRPEEMAAAMTTDGWLRTGDIGFLDENGYLFLLDRQKDVIITGGENVYPVEVENVLAAHPAIAEVAVIGAPDERWGETVVAVIVPVAGSTIPAGEIIAYTRERLAAFKCPRRVEFCVTLPRTATGKIRKDQVREPFWVGYDGRIN